MPGYVHRTTLRFRDTDAAGIIYFTGYFTLAHEALEACMIHYNLGVGRVLREMEYILPLVHADGDFSGSLRVDDVVVIVVTASQVGNTSFTIAYEMTNIEGIPVCTARTVHVALHRQSQRPMPLPDEVRAILEKIAPGT
jgi:1,4-dihydroxy-2-naphthoyl-CoA hydrolase